MNDLGDRRPDEEVDAFDEGDDGCFFLEVTALLLSVCTSTADVPAVFTPVAPVGSVLTLFAACPIEEDEART